MCAGIDLKMCSGGIEDKLDFLLARLRHIICEIEEIMDDIEELKGDYNGNDSKGAQDLL